MIGVGILCAKVQECNPYRFAQVCFYLSILGDLFLKGWYFGVSGVKVEYVTKGFERIFQEELCVFLEPGACF